MASPWVAVTAAEYEEHMGPDGVGWAAPLSGIFRQVYRTFQPGRLLVPGCGPGGGLEHVDPGVTCRAVGIDLNIQYVTMARQRYRKLGASLEIYCADALRARLQPAADFDLIHVALLFEHVEASELAREIAGWLAPGGTCAVVLQRPGPAAPGASAAGEALRRVAAEMRPVAPGELARLLEAQGLRRAGSWEVPAAGGVRFHVGLFRAPAAPARRAEPGAAAAAVGTGRDAAGRPGGVEAAA